MRVKGKDRKAKEVCDISKNVSLMYLKLTIRGNEERREVMD
jgi:hypothetical protein